MKESWEDDSANESEPEEDPESEELESDNDDAEESSDSEEDTELTSYDKAKRRIHVSIKISLCVYHYNIHCCFT